MRPSGDKVAAAGDSREVVDWSGYSYEQLGRDVRSSNGGQQNCSRMYLERLDVDTYLPIESTIGGVGHSRSNNVSTNFIALQLTTLWRVAQSSGPWSWPPSAAQSGAGTVHAPAPVNCGLSKAA
ncbi:uncharacterized protein LOC133883539 [Phragmites australis]|uniref:uncharacterized protein LOC133883539 n=1 Tax=Phragmites australis TaxID=29695 RepID=UPI002D79FAA8|nr:uncharacterized protein LOC133883539 [Phragmites australis]